MAESILTKKPLWEALAVEIDKPIYSALTTDRELLGALNAAGSTLVPGMVPVSRLIEALLAQKKWGAIRKATASDTPVGDAASALWGLLTSRSADDIQVSSGASELREIVRALVPSVLDADDVTALEAACRLAEPAPSPGREIAIGEICATHLHQARNNGATPDWKGDLGIRSAGAAAINDTFDQQITNAEPAAGAYEWSLQIDGGLNTLISEVTVFATAADWAGVPTGYLTLIVLPYYATGGTAFDSAPPGASFAVSADAQYDFYASLHLAPCQFFKVGIYNGTDQAIDTDDLNVWAYYEKITV